MDHKLFCDILNSEMELATGSQTIPVRVYLDGRSDVGVVGEYNIVVSLTRE